MLAALALMLVFPPVVLGQVKDGVPPPKHKWTKFVTVAGQPEPVPAEWVSTPEGQFAHSIVLPNPVPKDSGYRWWWSAKKYFLHLCEKEAGEFVFKTVDNVEGFLFMRPPNWPTDFDLKDRYKLEAPHFEARFQLMSPEIVRRGTQFVSPPHRNYSYYEEPELISRGQPSRYLVARDYEDRPPRLTSVVASNAAASRYAVTWRGLRRPADRENAISGVEVVLLDRDTDQILGVLRTFGISGRTKDTPDGLWWLNAAYCAQFSSLYGRPEYQQLYGFVAKVLHPRAESVRK